MEGPGCAPFDTKIAQGGVLTADDALLRQAARDMLVSVLSCRDNMSNSGVVACVAGAAINAGAYLPNMATDEFLSCLSRGALERSAAAEGVWVEVRVKDTRARMVERFKDGVWLFSAGTFTPSPEAIASLAEDATDEPDAEGTGDDDGTCIGGDGFEQDDEATDDDPDTANLPPVADARGLPIAAE